MAVAMAGAERSLCLILFGLWSVRTIGVEASGVKSASAHLGRWRGRRMPVSGGRPVGTGSDMLAPQGGDRGSGIGVGSEEFVDSGYAAWRATLREPPSRGRAFGRANGALFVYPV